MQASANPNERPEDGPLCANDDETLTPLRV
jgi:hypothetical protein